MAVHIEEMRTEINTFAGDLPLSPEQIDQLVKLVIKRLEHQDRDKKASREATSIKPQVAPGATSNR